MSACLLKVFLSNFEIKLGKTCKEKYPDVIMYSKENVPSVITDDGNRILPNYLNKARRFYLLYGSLCLLSGFLQNTFGQNRGCFLRFLTQKNILSSVVWQNNRKCVNSTASAILLTTNKRHWHIRAPANMGKVETTFIVEVNPRETVSTLEWSGGWSWRVFCLFPLALPGWANPEIFAPNLWHTVDA